MSSRASIVVPTRNNLPHLAQCLTFLYRSLGSDDEVILVVNGTTGENATTLAHAKTMAETAPVSTRVIDMTPEAGFLTAANAGLESARGKYLVLLHDDVTVPSTWLTRLLEALERARTQLSEVKWGYVGPVTNAGGFPLQDIKTRLKGAGTVGELSQVNGRLFASNDVPWFTSAGNLASFCVLMTREAYKAVGAFDVGTFGLGGYEMNDLMLRAREKGFVGLLCPKVLVHHESGATLGRYAPQLEGGAANREAFMRKWRITDTPRVTAAYRVRLHTERDRELLCRSLTRMAELCDLAVICDDRSTIDLSDVIQSAPKGFVRQYFKLPKNAPESEAYARSQLLTAVRTTNPDWIWVADHDEWPAATLTKERLHTLCRPRNPLVESYTASIYVLWRGEEFVRSDRTWGNISREFLFRNRPCWTHIYGQEGAVSCRRIPSILPDDLRVHTGMVSLCNYEYASPDAVPAGGPAIRRLLDAETAVDHERESPVELTKAVFSDFSHVLLARNELRDVLRHVFEYHAWAHDFLVVDTGSIDQTADVLAHLGIRHERWRCCPNAEDPEHMLCNFADARNFATDKCSTDYILTLDPDERLSEEAAGLIPRLLLQQNDGYAIDIFNYRRTKTGEVKIQPTTQPRLYRRRPELVFEPEIHETLEAAFGRHPSLRFDKVEGMVIHHDGFLRHDDGSAYRNWKNQAYVDRLLELLQREPDDPRALYALSQHLIAVGEDEDGEKLMKKALELRPNFFHCRYAYAVWHMQRAHALLLDAPRYGFQFEQKRALVDEMVKDLGKYIQR